MQLQPVKTSFFIEKQAHFIIPVRLPLISYRMTGDLIFLHQQRVVSILISYRMTGVQLLKHSDAELSFNRCMNFFLSQTTKAHLYFLI